MTSFLSARLLLPFLGLSLVALSWQARGADPQIVRLWEGDAPGATGKEAKDIPQLQIYALEKQSKPTAALVILPGGGYGGLAIDHEGHQIARWANSLGMSAFICEYRHRGKGYGHPNPMLDAQRAVRTVRAEAAKWNVDPNRIGIIGFSAGGHLASTVLTHFDDGQTDAKDSIDRVSSRPDFGILCYAVIDLDQPHTHKGSQKNLLGENPDPELVKSLTNSIQVTERTPPTFLWSTEDDTVVPVENSLRFYSAMAQKKVPGELHVLPHGRHGLGLAPDSPHVAQWVGLCRNWLKQSKFITE
ncbi:MAG: alpha/beta hydrolase [Pirellulales bacterium]